MKPVEFKEKISDLIYQNGAGRFETSFNFKNFRSPSAVLVLLGPYGSSREPGIILNKRSKRIKQAGDLCCPGGGSTALDALISRLLFLPGSPLRSWRFFSLYRTRDSDTLSGIAYLLATAIRETVEEMRINPLRVRFLGPLPPQRLELFQKTIFPMVAWTDRSRPFRPNWEVEKIVHIPLHQLLDPANYARYRLEFPATHPTHSTIKDYPCFHHRQDNESELLWGATYRIVMAFLNIAFNFVPPVMNTLPVIDGVIRSDYLTGSRSI